jgi:hypothetical protein
LDNWETRERVPATRPYVTFKDVAEAIDELGPLEVCNDRVNVFSPELLVGLKVTSSLFGNLVVMSGEF